MTELMLYMVLERFKDGAAPEIYRRASGRLPFRDHKGESLP